MVRNAGMSRGCATCRKRRIKCDEKFPSCSQCSRGGRSCPGPVRGRIFLLTESNNPRKRSRHEDITEIGSFPTDLLQNSHFQIIEGCTAPIHACQKESLHFTHNAPSNRAGERCSSLADLSIVANPSPTNLTEMQLISKFVSFFSKSSINKTKFYNKSWMAMLPVMLSNGQCRRAIELKSSLLAASLALSSSKGVHNNHYQNVSDVDIQARILYSTSLKQQRVKMLLGAHSPDKIIPLVEDVAIAVILAYYEVISPTFETAYFQHILGAKTLLEMIGPRNCREGYCHQLFRTVRLYMVHISLTTRFLTSFSSVEWSEIPFSIGGKTNCDRVIDILLQLPRLWLSYDENFDAPYLCHRYTIMDSVHQLQGVWRKMQHCYQGDESSSQMHMPNTQERAMNDFDIGGFEFVPSSSITLSDSETAITIAYYSLAWIFILDQIRVQFPEMMNTCEQLLVRHSNTVIKACSSIDEFEDGCGFVRMGFPLRSVALLSPSSLQRDYAKHWLHLWRVNKGLNGICAVATRSESLTSRDISAG